MLSLLVATGLAVPASAGETLRFYDELPSTLNPLYADDLADMRSQSLIFDRLFDRSAIA